MSLVSVIVPAFDAERTIAATVGSALAQTHAELEVLVVDDGSTDGTASIVEAIDDPRVRLLRHDNAGQAEARNRGMAAARGDFLAFLDADDAWTPDKLEAQLAALSADPRAGVAYSWTDYVDGKDRFVHRGSHLTFEGDVLERLFQLNFVESGSNLLVRRAVADQVGGYAADLVPAEDWDWSLRLAERARFAAVARPQVLYRIGEGSQSTGVERMLRSCEACLSRAVARNPRLGACSSQALANIHRYLLYKLLEQPPAHGRAPGSFRRATRLLRGLQRHDARAWRRSVTRRVLARALAFSWLPGPFLRRVDRQERGIGGLLRRRLSVAALLGRIRVL